eukprot:scaffold639_cov304-Pinguiococcus_pyrenoidosus.AAC.4
MLHVELRQEQSQDCLSRRLHHKEISRVYASKWAVERSFLARTHTQIGMGGCCAREEEKHTPLLLDYSDVSSSRYGPDDEEDPATEPETATPHVAAFLAHDSTKKGKKVRKPQNRRNLAAK